MKFRLLLVSDKIFSYIVHENVVSHTSDFYILVAKCSGMVTVGVDSINEHANAKKLAQLFSDLAATGI